MEIIKGPLEDEPGHDAGWSLIFSPSSGSYQLASEHKLGFWERSFGKHRFFHVFTAPHPIELDYQLQTAQSTYKFKARVTAMAAARDPVAVLQHGIRDTLKSLRQPIGEALQNAVRSVDFQQADLAWREGLDALKQLKHPFIQLSDIGIEIEPDAAAREALRTIESEQLIVKASVAKSNAKSFTRAQLLECFESTDNMRVFMATVDDPKLEAMLREEIERRERQDAELTNRQIETFKFLVSTGHIEEHETLEGLRNLLEQINRTHHGRPSSTRLLDAAVGSGAQDEKAEDGDEAKKG
jgi:hypothetical protein